MENKTFTQLVRALANINNQNQENEEPDMNEAKIFGSTVEYFRALVKASKEVNKKPDIVSNLAEFEGEVDDDPDHADTSLVTKNWFSLVHSEDLISMLKNVQHQTYLNDTGPIWSPDDSSTFNLTSFAAGNSSDLYNGTGPFSLDSFNMGGFTNLSNLKDLLGNIKQNLDEGAKLSDSVIYSLIAIYSLVIVVGVLGNILILWAVLGREAMRTGRNVFIGTLAASDLFLCVFTMPSTLWEVLYRRWPFGPGTEMLCRFANAGRATPVFMSSFAIGAIAVDRYRCIMQPDKPELSVRASVIISSLLGLISAMMSVPLFVGTQLKEFVQFRKGSILKDIQICNDIRSGAYRWGYNMTSCFVQFILPLLIVFTVYASIYLRLKVRPQSQHSANNRRRRRTNILIILVTLVFFLSWLPHNTLNLLLDFRPKFVDSLMGNGGNIHALVYGICHITGLANACINPVLYGYLNENFRKEYQHIFKMFPWHRRQTERRRTRSIRQNRYNVNNNDLERRERIPLAPRQPCLEPRLSVMHPVVIIEMPTSTDTKTNNNDMSPEEEEVAVVSPSKLQRAGSRISCSSRGTCNWDLCSCETSRCSSAGSSRSSFTSEMFPESRFLDAAIQCEAGSIDRVMFRVRKINSYSQTSDHLICNLKPKQIPGAWASSSTFCSHSVTCKHKYQMRNMITPLTNSISLPTNLNLLPATFALEQEADEKTETQIRIMGYRVTTV